MIRATLKFRGQFVRDYTVEKAFAIIGRDPTADIKIENKGIMPKHCKISQKGSKYLLEDLGSPEGLDLNGEKLRMSQLRKGDVLTLGGNFSLEFDFEEEPPAPSVPESSVFASSLRPTSGATSPEETPAAALPKDSTFHTEATMRVSTVDFQVPQPVEIPDDLEIEPLSITELSSDLASTENREQILEKINGLLLSLDDENLRKVARILEILYE